MKTIRDIQYFEGVKILVRVDFNVPVQKERVVDDFRIRMALPTIKFLQEKGAKVILMSHIETNEGENISFQPIADHMAELGVPVLFIKDYKKAHETIENQLKNGEVALLENLRFFDGEKKNDQKFAKELASFGDIYVDEAFPSAHREHASIVGVPQFLPGYAGLQFEKEVLNLTKTFNPTHPFIFLLNGIKFETKMPLLKRFLEIADTVFVGGALATDFFKQKGYEVGRSIVSGGDIDLAPYLANSKLLLPVDVIDEGRKVYEPESLPKESKIVDIGPKTLELLKSKIQNAKFILWNGPTGIYQQGYGEATEELARIIAAATTAGATSVIGGGDTVAAIENIGLTDKFTFVSSGGGAMLDFLATGTLPGIEALNRSN